MKVVHFKSGAEFRAWLAANHLEVAEVWVGFYKKDSGRTGITYQEALDEALCHGWIDGIRKRVDELSYTNRFTPRRARSIWSAINLKRIKELMAQGRMHPHGQKVYEGRDPKRAGLYSFENRPQEFAAGDLRKFKQHKTAWAFFEAQPPGYRRLMLWRIYSAKKEETRQRRLVQLIEISAKQKRMKLM
jgi:uncharacterized protein YdeI (YjbR/CyaY-like superfamily)